MAVRALHELGSLMAETTSTPGTIDPPQPPQQPPQGAPPHQELADLSTGVASADLDDEDRITQRIPRRRADQPKP